ncbi:Defb18 [Phodopus roborovskii]|uniref:Defb18 protein n=1 Tax=Phodopus roborovskii TaxID=109678 RepID=A0AAV0A5B9_PHORO|nr:Defb18 [Phodopus roborovskii]
MCSVQNGIINQNCIHSERATKTTPPPFPKQNLFDLYLTVIFTVCCGPLESVERTQKSYVIQDSCKSDCSSREYVYNYCDIRP